MRESAIAWLTKGTSVLDRSTLFIRWVNNIGIGCFMVMVIFTFIDVILRYIFNRPIHGGFEITELIMVIAIFFAVAYTQVQKLHVSMDFVAIKLSPRLRALLKIVTLFFSIGVLVLITWKSYDVALHYWDTHLTTRVLRVPVSPFVLVVTFGCALLALVLIRDFLSGILNGLKLKFGLFSWLSCILIIAALTAIIVIWLSPSIWTVKIPPLLLGIGGLILCLLVFFTAMPVAFAMALVGFAGIVYVRGFPAAYTVLGTAFYSSTASYTWAVLPFFILMGFFAMYSAINKDLYRAAYCWLGGLRGGLAIATIGGCAGFAAIVGDTISGSMTMAAVSLPEMRRYKYSDSLAFGSVASGGIIGPLIPPSIIFVIYALITEQSVGVLFIAGILPGLLLTVLFMVSIYIQCRLNPKLGPPGPPVSFKEKMVSLKGIWPIVVLFVLVIGGIYAGVFTPTEGGGIGAFGALIIGMAMRRFNWKKFNSALLETGKMSGMLFLLLGAATVFGSFFVASKFPTLLAQTVIGLNAPPLAIIILIVLVLLILGCVMSAIPMVLITTPIFYPIIVNIGYDPIWFGVIIALMFNLAAITPPYGINLFALKTVDKSVPLSVIMQGVMPFVIAALVCVAIIVVFPQIATILPQLLGRL